MFGRTWKVFSIARIPVQVDSSWLVMAAFFVFAFYNSTLVEQPGLGTAGAVAFALAEAGLFFGSVLFHEGAHAWVCRLNDIEVKSITMFALGGFTSAHIEEKGPKEEFLVAIVGPLSSLLLAVAFRLTADTDLFGPAVTDSLLSLAFVNLLLGLFNLLPGFPLDGGRVMRSLVWGATKDRRVAARVARWSGQIAGVGLIAYGAIQFSRGAFGALFTALIGGFLFQAARQTEGLEVLRQLLEGGTVADAMAPPPTAIPGEMTLTQALDTYLRGNEERTFPVVDGARLMGVLTFQSAARVGQHDPMRPVREAVVPVEQIKRVRNDMPLQRAIHELSGGGALVVDVEGNLVGRLGVAEVEAWANRPSRDAGTAANPEPGDPGESGAAPPRPDV